MPKKYQHIAIICNPKAGNGNALRVAEKIVSLLKEKQVLHSLFTAHWPQGWNDITQTWIVGGDGTLNYFINQYPDIKLPLCIFKGGTGNDFHELLYGKITVEEQVAKILNATAHKVDAGICNKKLFLNGIGIGFDGAIVQDLVSRKKLKKKSSYLYSIFKNIFIYREKKCLLKFDEQMISQECFMVNIANGKTYGGGFKVAPKADIDDGKLDINIVGTIAPLKRFFYVPLIEKGKHLALPFIQYYQSGKIEIQSQGILPAHSDGEHFNADCFFIECLPKRFSFLW